MSIAKLWKTKFSKISQFLLVFAMITAWIFSGFPQIWPRSINPDGLNYGVNKIRIPPKIKQVQAATVTLLPNAAGTNTNWTYVGGSLNYTNLQTNDGDTTYAQSPTTNNVNHTVNLDNTTLDGTINSVTAYVVGRAPTATEDHQIKVYVSASAYLAPTEFEPTATYAAYSWVMTVSPATGLAWTWAEVNGLEVGVETDVNASTLNYTQFYAVVDYTPPTVTVGATGTQTLNMNVNSTNNYVGGAFTFVRDAGTATTTQIIITDAGTVNANLNLSNVDLYYETAATCTYDANETLFGTAASFDASEKATVSGTMAVGTSQVCVYVVLDVGSGASANETVEIEISSPSTEVTVSDSTVSPTTPVAITGTTTLQAGAIISVSVSDGVIAYGMLLQNSTSSTILLSDTQILTNNGTVAETFNVMGSTSTNWTLAATAGTDVYVHKFCTSTCATPPTNYTALTLSYQTANTNVSVNATTTLDLMINTPNPSTSFATQSVDVIIQAVQ